jgi:hypothetical protein
MLLAFEEQEKSSSATAPCSPHGSKEQPVILDDDDNDDDSDSSSDRGISSDSNASGTSRELGPPPSLTTLYPCLRPSRDTSLQPSAAPRDQSLEDQAIQ